MKKNSLLTLALIAFIFANSNAQSWLSGTNKLYTNPTSTNVVIGTSSPSSILNLYGSTKNMEFLVNNKTPKLKLTKNGSLAIVDFSSTAHAKFHIEVGTSRGIHLNLSHTGN